VNGAVPIIVVDTDGLSEWWRDEQGLSRQEFALRKIQETGSAVFCWQKSGRFSWVCPQCGCPTGGQLGTEPVSGWEDPRWVNSGTHDRPTLTPSLGCPGFGRGECTGHYWLRDGVLIPA
jgi:hypothetical protein